MDGKTILNSIRTFFNTSDFYKELIETRDAIGKMSDRIATLEQKISELMEITTQIKEKAAIQPSKEELEFDKKYFYYKDKSGHLYCPPCYDDKQKLIKLKPCANTDYGWECPSCKNIVRNPDYHPKPINLPRQGRMY